MKTLTFYLFLLIFPTILLSQDQDRVYEIKALGTEIGSSVISKRVSGDTTYYHTQSLLEVNLLIKRIRMEVSNHTSYHAGQLISSHAEVLVNGEPHTSSSVVWQNPTYLVRVDGEQEKTINFPITYSGTLLFFEEPKGIDQAFVEASGLFMAVKSQQAGRYHLSDLKNKRNMHYVYEDGILMNLMIKHPLLTVKINLVDSKKPIQ